MAVSRRFGLGVGAFAITAVLVACGDSEGGKDKDAGPARDGSTAGGGDGGGPLIDIAIAQLDDNTAGTFCETSADCKGSEVYCVDNACTGVCENNKNCGAGGTCVQPVAGQNGLCGKLCKQNSDCGEGLDCRSGFDFGDLISAVEDAGIMPIDAGIDLRNVPKTCGASLGVVELPDGVVGTPCTNATPCEPGECATNINFLEPFPNGYCTGKCLADSDCGSGGICYKDPITALGGLEGRCLLGCSSSASCRSGQVCRVSPIIDSKSYCLPPAANTVDAGGTDAGVTNDI
jgi:hypothetical protein